MCVCRRGGLLVRTEEISVKDGLSGNSNQPRKVANVSCRGEES